MTTAELTDEQREQRRQQARTAIETGLREWLDVWYQTPLRLDWAADAALDVLGDLAAEILVDGTMLRALTIRDGVATLELAEATEMVRIFAAGMRGVLDGHGASNYVETRDALVVARRILGTTEQAQPATALRDRIRRVLCEADGRGFMWGTDMLEPDEYGEVANAVLAVLPAPAVDRAAHYHDAADAVRDTLAPADWPADGISVWNAATNIAESHLRRLAAEAQQPTPAPAEETK